VTTNSGASFNWTPITRDSVRDNFRPIAPRWGPNNSALLWIRGTYNTAQSFDAAIVGLIERRAEIPGLQTYVDADTTNTTLAAGGALVTGPGANQWHLQTGGGNSGSVFSSADSVGENAPTLKTTVAAPVPGTYDVWVNFWANPNADWRVMAGLSTNNLQLFRQMASQEVEPGEHDTALVLTNAAGYYLYQAYVGRMTNATFDVFVDDNSIQTGTIGTQIGSTARTWYDGVSFASVNPLQIQNITRAGSAVTLTWNSVPTQSSLTTPTYTVQKKNLLSDVNWTTVVSGVPSAGSTTSYMETNATTAAAFYRITSP
jgi:hypothetical protein